MRVKVEHGDSREVLKGLADCSVASIVTDPPYSLQTINKRFAKVGRNDKTWSRSGPHQRTARGFMGKKWDTGETAFDPEFWVEVLRVLKPGGHVLAFGGTRTYHRLVGAIEDAGFEIRDTIGWLFGQGFPKSHNVAKGIDKAAGREIEVVPVGKPVKRMIPGADQNKAGWEKNNGREYQPGEYVPSEEAAPWEGWGTALKPAMELICVARKPLQGTVAENVLAHGTGAINVEACRILTAENLNGGTYSGQRRTRAGVSLRDDEPGAVPLSRLRNGAGEFQQPPGRWPANVVHDGSDEVIEAFPNAAGQQRAVTGRERAHRTLHAYGDFGRSDGGMEPRGDAGSAARFFYSSKADADDRLGSKHPTVKPVDLMRWLVRLVTPPGGLVLDPFAGSGSTGMACLAEGFDCLLIEREAEYVADIRRRLAHVRGDDTPLFAGPA